MAMVLIVLCFIVTVVVAKLVEVRLRRPLIENINTDRYVFITGCDTGFGNKLARQLDTKGVHVIATCLTEKGVEELRQATSERTKILQMDVTSHESVLSALEEVKKILPHESALWGVVNNAGIGNFSGFLELSRLDDYQKVISVNLFGGIDVTLTFLPLLKKSRGRLVNVSSIAGRLASFIGGYAESKFALEAFSDVVRFGDYSKARNPHGQPSAFLTSQSYVTNNVRQMQTLGYGIQVSLIEPGFFATNMGSRDAITKSVIGCWERLTADEKREFPKTIVDKYLSTKVKNFDQLFSTNLNLVTDSMEHALFAKWPRTRYVVGWDAKLVWAPISLLPTRVADVIVCYFS